MATKSEKKETVNQYLEEEYCLIHFDTTLSGVEVPTHLMDNPSVTLKLSHGFQGGMEVNNDRIWASLLFGTQYCECVVPFDALWGATCSSGANVIWPEDAPNEILLDIMKSLQHPEATPLKEVKESSQATKPKMVPKPKIKRKSSEVPYLKRVK